MGFALLLWPRLLRFCWQGDAAANRKIAGAACMQDFGITISVVFGSNCVVISSNSALFGSVAVILFTITVAV